MAGPLLKDARWVRQSFLVRAEDLERVDLQNRTFSTVQLKFTDTTPGGNFAINPPPQFTRFCDLKSPGRFAKNHQTPGRKGGSGMGRYYSEAIDDNAQVIHMRFGVAQFTAMNQFWTSFYNTSAGQLARTGRARSAFYYLGRAAGFIVSVMSWKLLAFHALGVAARFFLGFNNSSKFYYLKPAMPLYWNAVTTMVNHLAVNRGIIPRIGDRQAAQFPGASGNEEAIRQMHSLLPDIFKENGGVDVYALANRAQRLARKNFKRMEEVMNAARNLTDEDLSRKIQQINSEILEDTPPSLNGPVEGDTTQTSYLARWFKSQQSSPNDIQGNQVPGTEAAITPQTVDDGFWTFLGAELDDGGAFASFRVNSTGPVNESFTNNVGESDIANKVNSMSASARNTSFSFGNGNLVGGAIGATLGAIVGAVKDVGAGIMDQLNISGLAALGGAAFVDIPKHWQSSMAQLPRASYTIQLVSPYGNPISQLINLYIPLAMLLAGALPLSTGRQSYTSPFLLELYDQGRCQTRLGMIDSLQITRGTGNLGFNADGHVMAIDVSFSVVDMSSIMHLPISEGFTMGTGTKIGAITGAVAGTALAPGAGTAAGIIAGTAVGASADFLTQTFNGVFADDNAFTDYMAVIAGMGLADQIYQWRKLKLNLTKTRAQWDSYTSLSRLASFAGDTMPGRLMAAVYQGTWRDGPSLLRPQQ